MSETMNCPCCSGKTFDECCSPVIKGTRKAATPEELMRARYSAYTQAEIDFIIDSTHPDHRNENDRKDLQAWAETSQWLGLNILKTEDGPDENTGFVEFVASYNEQGVVHRDHHEYSEFRKVDGDWFFYDGKIVAPVPFVRQKPKVGPNDPCPCGSGKKYKKCCGK